MNITILPYSVSFIQKYAFFYCLNLKYINFPISVKSVDEYAFVKCKSIRCPTIENTIVDYISMLVKSGIRHKYIYINNSISCEDIEITHNIKPQIMINGRYKDIRKR